MDIDLNIVYAEVEKLCSSDSTGHDWWHIRRVTALALKIAETVNACLQLVELAALLHDADDWKLTGTETDYPNTRKIMADAGADSMLTDTVIRIIGQVSFKGAGVDTTTDCPEAQVVQDADRLDAIGAIGIARAFAYGGAKGRAIFTPQQKPVNHQSFEEYRNSNGHTINHFYEKLLLLKDRLNTDYARRIAQERHSFMEYFLVRFFSEWNEPFRT